MSTTRADRTAIRRTALSRPVALALDDGLIHRERTFFDYGCGRGDDLLRLHKIGIPVSGWDPAFFPDEERSPADIVNLGYVVNVIEDPAERVVVLTAAWELARKVLIVSARLDWEATDAAVDFKGDGIVTGKRTFQKFFTQEELRLWIEQALDRRPVAAAPGIFYVFRDEADAQSFAVNRVFRQRRIPDVEPCQELVSDNKELVDTLMAFVTERGRLPADAELATAPQLARVFGSVARAFALLRRVTSADRWDSIRRERRADVLVYLALAAFPKRPRFGALPDELQRDIRAFFGSYQVRNARRLTRSCSLLGSGCRGPSLPRCQRRQVVARRPLRPPYRPRIPVPGAARLRRVRAPARRCRPWAHARQALPPTRSCVVPGLRGLRPGGTSGTPECRRRRSESARSPISTTTYTRRIPRFCTARSSSSRTTSLHASSSPGLSAREDRLGLLSDSSTIGTRNGWLAVLSKGGVSIHGHRIFRHV